MRVALWTPSPESGWAAAVAPHLARDVDLVLVGSTPARAPDADVDMYHVAGPPAYGFVYQALLERPGLVVLEQWNLHALVLAETAGRGNPDVYRREARRAHGERGTFVARQVLAGLGGALQALLAMNQRVLEASLGLVAFDEGVCARAAALLPGRPVEKLAFDRRVAGAKPAAAYADGDASTLADALLRLIRELAPGAEQERHAFAARRAEEGTPLASALAELGWAARELGLAHPPDGTDALVAPLFRNAP